MTLLLVVAVGVMGWFHGREMYAIGKLAGRREELERQVQQTLRARGEHLRVVK